MIRRRAIAHGRVQGVGFRDWTQRQAQQRGVGGWVRNRPDGAVEAVLEGEEDAVDVLVDLLRQGPRGASVERVELEDEQPEGLRGFAVRF